MQMKDGTGAVELKGIHKVTNGKLIRCKIMVDDDVIKNITITGDFFVYPENLIEKIEASLKNISINSIIDQLQKSIPADALIVGFSVDDLCRLLTTTLNKTPPSHPSS